MSLAAVLNSLPEDVQRLFQDLEHAAASTVDGILYHPETGEELAIVPPEEGFRVRDDASLDWVLSKIARREARRIAVLNDADVIAARALVANADEIARRADKERDSLVARFGDEILAYVQLATEKTSGRTWRTTLGTCSLRTVGASFRVKDEAAAVRMARLAYPHALSESFKPSQLTKEEKAAFVAGLQDGEWPEDDLAREALEYLPERDSLTIKTGVVARG